MSVVVIDTTPDLVAPAQPAPAPSVIAAVMVPWSTPEELYFLALYMLPVIAPDVSNQAFTVMFEVLTTDVSQLVILYSKPNVCVVQAFELPDDITSRLSLFVGGGIGVIVKVGVIVGVLVRVQDRLTVGVYVGVEGFDTDITYAIAPTRPAL